jgi:hypothetical protein
VLVGMCLGVCRACSDCVMRGSLGLWKNDTLFKCYLMLLLTPFLHLFLTYRVPY